MIKFLTAALILGLLTASIASPAEAYGYRGHGGHGGVYIGIGGGYYPGYGYDPYYPGYYPPPPVVYAPPPVYAAPYYAAPAYQAPVYAQPSYAAPAYAEPSYAPPAVDQASSTFTDDQGRSCREYQSNSTVAGRRQSTYGTACLQPDGSWRIVE